MKRFFGIALLFLAVFIGGATTANADVFVAEGYIETDKPSEVFKKISATFHKFFTLLYEEAISRGEIADCGKRIDLILIEDRSGKDWFIGLGLPARIEDIPPEIYASVSGRPMVQVIWKTSGKNASGDDGRVAAEQLINFLKEKYPGTGVLPAKAGA
jgi:hypothetical protein